MWDEHVWGCLPSVSLPVLFSDLPCHSVLAVVSLGRESWGGHLNTSDTLAERMSSKYGGMNGILRACMPQRLQNMQEA